MQKPTKTENTKSSYLKRALQKAESFSSETKLSALTDFDEFIKWLIKDTTGKSSSNWRMVKASCVHYFEANNAEKAAQSLLEIGNEHTANKPIKKNTSAKKKKFITELEERILVEEFKEKASKEKDNNMSKAAYALFKAGLLTGLRPVEWENAYYSEEALPGIDLKPPVLKVKNAKATNNRSYDEYRYLGLSNFSFEERLWIKVGYLQAQDPRNAQKEKIPYNQLYEMSRVAFYQMNQRLFPKSKTNITLYSCRHQFIANAKASGMTLAEIACLVGHGTDVTASVHYGKKQNGRGSVFPEVHQPDLAKIKQIYSQFEPGQQLKPTLAT